MADFTIKRGNHFPSLYAYPVWPETVQDMPDWTGSTARFVIRRAGDPSPVLVLPATSWSWSLPSAGRMEGVAKYAWAAPPTPAETLSPVAGLYDCELEVTLATSKRVTFPNGGYNSIEFVEKLSV